VTIAMGEGDPEQIVLDDANVYWIDEYAAIGVHACSRTRGCATSSTLLVASDTKQIAYQVAVAPDALYYSDGYGDLYRADKSVPSTGAPIAETGALVSDLTYFAGDLVWAAFDQAKSASFIQACNAASCRETLRVVTASTLQAAAVAVDASGLYFIDGFSEKGSLYHCPDAGACASPDVLTTNIAQPGRMIVDAKNVYFIRAIGSAVLQNTVFVCPKSGCAAPAPVATVDALVRSLATDGKYIYFVSGSPNDAPTGALHRITAPP
jgi:hypothetical protein